MQYLAGFLSILAMLSAMFAGATTQPSELTVPVLKWVLTSALSLGAVTILWFFPPERKKEDNRGHLKHQRNKRHTTTRC